jgi:predicted nuclease of predicted toxin-antitoxin system
MRFLVDANLPRSALPLLARLGHHAEHVRDVGLHSATDELIAAHARSTRAIILTRDLDFADVRRYPPHEYFGIVVLRLPDEAIVVQILAVLDRFLSHANIVDRLAGRLIILEMDRFRARPPLE